MSNMIKTISYRSPNAASQDGKPGRIESVDGMRRASSLNCKKSIGPGRYAIVTAWTIREKVDGKWVVVRSGLFLKCAQEWCGLPVTAEAEAEWLAR